MQITKSKWFLPLFAAALGVVMLVAHSIGGHASDGVTSLAIMLAVAALFLFGGRSETIRGLRGDGRDERFKMIDVHASALAGTAVIIAIIVGFVVEMARGHDGSPYTWLAAIAGITYILAVIALRLRS